MDASKPAAAAKKKVKAVKHQFSSQTETKKKKILADNNFRRILKVKDPEAWKEYKEQGSAARKQWRKKYDKHKNFDFIRTEKTKKETHRTKSHKGYRWRTQQQIEEAEGYTLQNKNKAALKNATNLIAAAKKDPKEHKVPLVQHIRLFAYWDH